MIGKYRMRTDLAMENQEKFERDHVEIPGVEIEKKKRKAEIQTTIVKITSEQGAKMMGKPKGTYVTIEAPLLLTADEEESRKAAEEFSHCLMEMVPEACGSVLVAGHLHRAELTNYSALPSVEINIATHLFHVAKTVLLLIVLSEMNKEHMPLKLALNGITRSYGA